MHRVEGWEEESWMKSLRTRKENEKFRWIIWSSRCRKKSEGHTHRLLIYYKLQKAAALLEEQEPQEQQQRTPHGSNTHHLTHTNTHTSALETCWTPDTCQYLLRFSELRNQEGNFETWPGSVNRSSLNHMSHEAISPIDYWLSKVGIFIFKITKTQSFSRDWSLIYIYIIDHF